MQPLGGGKQAVAGEVEHEVPPIRGHGHESLRERLRGHGGGVLLMTLRHFKAFLDVGNMSIDT